MMASGRYDMVDSDRSVRARFLSSIVLWLVSGECIQFDGKLMDSIRS
jgi:hypothetical protein